MSMQSQRTQEDYNAFAFSILKKLLTEHDDIVAVNPEGYLVLDSNEDVDLGGTGTRCVDLTPEEFEAVKEALRVV